MIQFKRGKTREWIAKMNHMEKLAPGQPGYDTDRRKMKIGDGKKTWIELPYAGGLNAEEILDSEKNARNRFSAFDKLLVGLGNLIGLDFSNDKVAIMTYGTERPDEDTVGQVYLQHFATEPETDYVVDSGLNGIWHFRKWHSGRAECFGSYTINTSLCEEMSGIALFTNNTSINKVPYPFEFIATPIEVASLASKNEFVWLVTKDTNSSSASSQYALLSCIQKQQQASYTISLAVSGRWR